MISEASSIILYAAQTDDKANVELLEDFCIVFWSNVEGHPRIWGFKCLLLRRRQTPGAICRSVLRHQNFVILFFICLFLFVCIHHHKRAKACQTREAHWSHIT